MGLEEYGAWAQSLDSNSAAKALLARGLVAAGAPSTAAAGSVDQIVDGLRGIVVGLQEDNFRLPWNRVRPWPWTDPLLLDDWDSAGEPPGELWAQAWDVVMTPNTYYFWLQMSVSARTDLIWLNELFQQIIEFASGFAAFPSVSASPWRFPLRVGFLPDERGRALHAELIAGFGNSSWQSTLIAPIVLGPASVSCDLMMLQADPREVSAQLLSMRREFRVGAVFVAHDLAELPALHTDVVEKISRATGAWAVGFTSRMDVRQFLVDLVMELSHAQPLDRAFRRNSYESGILAADPVVMSRETADQRATRLAGVLESLATDDSRELFSQPEIELAQELARIGREGEFSSEVTDASQVARLERQAAELIDRAGSVRRLQARISAPDGPAGSLGSFLPATQHSIDVRIGPFTDAAWLAAAAAFPEFEIEPDQPIPLTVVLTEPALLPRPQSRTIDLPAVGASTTATFTLSTAPDTVFVDARIIVLSGNRVLQTALLPSDVTGVSATAADAVAEPEVIIAPTTAGLADRRTFSAAFVINHNSDGASRATSIVGDRVGMVNLSGDTVRDARESIITTLTKIVERPEKYEGLTTEASIKLLRRLAFHGADLRTALVMDSPGLAEVLDRFPSFLQVVSAKPEANLPIEFAYDFAQPDENAGICPEGVSALDSATVTDRCPVENHPAALVCPFGFWGLSRVIERHAFQKESEVEAEFVVHSAASRGRQLISLAAAVYGASDLVDEVVPGGSATVAAALAAGGPYSVVPRWDGWDQAIGDAQAPNLILLLSHTVYSDDLGAYGLEIGADSRRYRIDKSLLPGHDKPMIVALLGCKTATAADVAYQQFPTKLRYAGADVVIATVTDMRGRHVAPIASRLVAEMHTNPSGVPRGMGEVMLMLRRRMLADGLLPVLSLVAFGDADWLIAP